MDISTLDRLARGVTKIVNKQSTTLYDAATLNELVGEAVGFRLEMAKASFVSPSSAERYLFENYTLDDVGHSFESEWTTDAVKAFTSGNFLVRSDNVKGWRNRSDYPDFASRWLKGVEIGLAWPNDEFLRGEATFHPGAFYPKFPEWYVYSTGPDALPDDSRRELIEMVLASAAELGMDQCRLAEGDVEPYYVAFFHQIVPGVQRASANDEVAKQAMSVFAGAYSICGLQLKADSLFELPRFYKEYVMHFFNGIFETPIWAKLREAVAEDG
jgi:hypothetical protein